MKDLIFEVALVEAVGLDRYSLVVGEEGCGWGLIWDRMDKKGGIPV